MYKLSQPTPTSPKLKTLFRLTISIILVILATPGCQDEIMDEELMKAELMAKGGSLYCPYAISSSTINGHSFTFVINENFKCYSYINFVLIKFTDCVDQAIKMDLSLIDTLIVNGKDYLSKTGVIGFTNTSDCGFGSKPGEWDGYILKMDFTDDVLYHPITIEISLSPQVSGGELLINAGDSKMASYCGGDCSGKVYVFEGHCDEGLIDIDGNVYDTITIGEQTWISENLKTTRFANGDLIGTTTPSTLDISGETDPIYQWAFDGDEGNADTLGRLYTWYTVTDDRNICPDGWHVPTSDEWTALFSYLETNSYGYEGSGDDIAKSLASASGWYTNDIYPGTIGFEQENNNTSGFNGFPAGERINGRFCWTRGNPGSVTSWWSVTADNDDTAMALWYNLMNKSSMAEEVVGPKIRGASVRCIKD